MTKLGHMSTTPSPLDPLKRLGLSPENLGKHAGWLKIEGVVFLVLGFAAILLPGVFSVGIELFLGWLFFIGGIFAAIGALQTIQSKGFLLRLASGVLTAIAGVLFITKPVEGVKLLTIVLGLYYLIDGICKIGYGLSMSGTPGAGMVTLNGIFGLIIAGMVYSQWPTSAIWFLGLIIGVNMIMAGGFLLSLSCAVKRGAGDHEQRTPGDEYKA